VKDGLNNIERYERRTITWLMGGIVVLAFIAGTVVDVDHPLAWVLGIRNGRFLHSYFAAAGLIFVGAGLILAIACLCRYARVRVLRQKLKVKRQKAKP
jgi:hypothetical protein